MAQNRFLTLASCVYLRTSVDRAAGDADYADTVAVTVGNTRRPVLSMHVPDEFRSDVDNGWVPDHVFGRGCLT